MSGGTGFEERLPAKSRKFESAPFLRSPVSFRPSAPSLQSGFLVPPFAVRRNGGELVVKGSSSVVGLRISDCSSHAGVSSCMAPCAQYNHAQPRDCGGPPRSKEGFHA